ncbi:phenylalanine-4-hydroxylase [Pedobacter cryoconitis]|uniref:Phenylalanine-4-hydroxylase n=1 Tax=Pedobacter cryoconitis TaxID=188932 RepID=A0A7W9DKQ8_9SPHI|nr:hypothetical protein [Pedobacter cryoconitis]MBB5622477.1 phenylalanine-4-hydroxylase [Pedobacter cryoconitis]
MKTTMFSPSCFDQSAIQLINLFLQKQALSVEKYRQCYHSDYIDGFNYLYPEQDTFSYESLTEKLAAVGWKPVYVEGYLSGAAYFGHLKAREIPVNINVRPADELDFASFPDLIHDLVGHCPMLVNPAYSVFLDELSGFICSIELEPRDHEYLALHRSVSEERNEILAEIEAAETAMKASPTPYYYYNSMALWIIEFGIIKNQDVTNAYGAALVASPFEIEQIAKGTMVIKPLTGASPEAAFNFSDLQNCLYSTESFEEAKEMVTGINSLID